MTQSDEISWLEDVIAEGNEHEKEEALAVRTELRTLRDENERLQNEAAKYKDWYDNMADEVIAQQTELAKQQKGGDDEG